MIFLKKNTSKNHIFFKCPEKMVFPKKIALEYDLSCIIWKDSIFFPGKYCFFFGRKIKVDLSQEIRKYDIFCIHV